MHVRGYKEEGTTTTPFDMVMLNDLDRFHLVMDVIDRVPGIARQGARAPADGERRLAARAYTRAARRRRSRDPRLDVALLNPESSSSTPARPASSSSVVDAEERSRPVRAHSRRRPAVAAVGHRVVHGGERFAEPTLIDDEYWRS